MKTQDIKNMAAAIEQVAENQKSAMAKKLAKSAAASEKGKAAVTLPKAPFEVPKEEMSSKEKMKRGLYNSKLDPVGQADADIDNDGDVDKSDKYLHNRRKTIKKAMKKDKSEVTMNAKVDTNATASEQRESADWPIYKRIMENRAAHYKGATEPMPADDGVSPNAKAMKKKMDDTKEINDYDEKGHDDASKAGRVTKKAPARNGDKADGDKGVVNPAKDTTK